MSHPRPPVEPSVGATVETRRVDVGAATLHVELRGDGAPLLLLHGFTGCGRDWQYAGRDALQPGHRLIVPDARGHGLSDNPGGAFDHRLCARDALALLDALGIERCHAIGLSLGGNTLLHMACMQPARIAGMVIVSATPRFPERARAIMRSTDLDALPAAETARLAASHPGGAQQIAALFDIQRGFADSHDDLCFTAESLAAIRARTLVIYGDRDPLYPLELGLELYRGIADAALWVVPGGGHVPVFVERAPAFAAEARGFLAAVG